ncbi:MAG: hypothetical protein K6T66_00850 [Peptococcaceae bacterium]|nr:hypothetical protein [Peptococcaceae bacterium]
MFKGLHTKSVALSPEILARGAAGERKPDEDDGACHAWGYQATEQQGYSYQEKNNGNQKVEFSVGNLVLECRQDVAHSELPPFKDFFKRFGNVLF